MKKLIFASLITIIIASGLFITNNSYAETNKCESNLGTCKPNNVTCLYGGLSTYDSACGTNNKCCKASSGASSETNSCTSNNGSCQANNASCLYGDLSTYDSACGTNNKCCKASSGSEVDNKDDNNNNDTTLNGIEVPSDTGLPNTKISTILTNIIEWLLKIFFMLAVLSFIITGIMFIIAMGNTYSNSAANAKKNFGNSIIALLIVGSSYIIITTISKLLNGEL